MRHSRTLAFEPLDDRRLLAVSFYGTDDADLFEFSPGRVVINGIEQSFAAGLPISFDGRPHHATETVYIEGQLGGAPADAESSVFDAAGNAVRLSLAVVPVSSDPTSVYRWQVGAAGGTLVFDSGGALSSATDTQLAVDGPAGTWSVNLDFSRVSSPPLADASHLYVRRDRAILTGTSAAETAELSPGAGAFTGGGFDVRVVHVADIEIIGGGGDDRATLHDSPGDDVLDADPAQATLTGADFRSAVVGFRSVFAYALAGGDDTAVLRDSRGDDQFVGTPEMGKLSGAGYLVRAKRFGQVFAYATAGGHDVARISGSGADDLLVSTPDVSRLTGAAYLLRAKLFDWVLADGGSGGQDRAVLRDSAEVEQFSIERDRVRFTNADFTRAVWAMRFPQVELQIGNLEDTITRAPDATADVLIHRTVRPDALSPTCGIQETIDALPVEGGIVTVPAGNYALRRGLVLPSNVTLRGQGAQTRLMLASRAQTRLKAPAAPGDDVLAVESSAAFQSGDEVTILFQGIPRESVLRAIVRAVRPGEIVLTAPLGGSLTFGPDQSARVVGYFPLVRAGAFTDGAAVVHDAVIENLTLDATQRGKTPIMPARAPAAVELIRTERVTVRDCTVTGSAGSGLEFIRGTGNRIESCTINAAVWSGIMFRYEAAAVVLQCTVRSPQTDGILAIGGSDMRIENSLVERAGNHGIHLGEGTRDAVVVNNISRYSGVFGLYFCYDVLRATVAENLFEENADSGIGGLGWGGEFGDRFNIVRNNVCRRNARWGIHASGGGDNTIVDNIVVDNSQQSPGQYSGIYLASTVRVVVSGNRSGSDGAVATQKYGIEETGASDLNTITANAVAGNLLGGVHVVGVNTQAHDNAG